MNKRNLFSLLLIATISLTSCKKELEPQESTPVDETAVTTDAVDNPTTDAANPEAQQGMPMTQNPNGATTNPAAVMPQTVAKGMNPAHGQPGHRCDIAVGAPLNSPGGANPMLSQPAATNSPMTVTPAQMNPNGTLTPSGTSTPVSPSTPAILAPQTETAVGMNPAHGQPGHRCDIAVGEALPKS